MPEEGAAASHPLLVDPEWLEAHLGIPRLVTLDVTVHSVPPRAPGGTWSARSGEAEWRAEHIPGSAFLDVLRDLTDPGGAFPHTAAPIAHARGALYAAGLRDGTHVVLYDTQTNNWACRVWWVLQAMGFSTVSVLDGGWLRWVAEGRPTSAEPQVAAPPGDLHLTPTPDLLCDRDAVSAAVRDAGIRLVNALPREEWDGTKPNSFARPGQIPGSVEITAGAVVDPATHAFRVPEELRAIADNARVGDAGAIVYCGAGISAAKTALALRLIGVENVSLYDGSLTEWAADPSLPMEVSLADLPVTS
jgi:thiosulfate/3-mercaptopyruvate sulfurtransferase